MSVILMQELPCLLDRYKERKPKSFYQFFLDENLNGENSYFGFGAEQIIMTNGCYAKAWNIILDYSSKIASTKVGKISAFLGMCGLDAYNNRPGHQEVISTLRFAIEIANLLKV